MNKFQAVAYNFSAQTYQTNIQVDIDEWCNGLTIRNTGTSMVNFQQEEIAPGESVAIGGNFGEIIRGRLDLFFTGAGNNKCVIRQKFYLNPPFHAPSSDMPI